MTENSAMMTYFKNLNKPLLTRAEEQAIFIRISNGDANAKNELIERNLRLVIPTVRQYLRCGIPFSDLVQEGNMAIVTACDKFDPALGNKFSTYATYWIKQRIGRYVKKHMKNVFVPEHIVNLSVQIAKVRRTLAARGVENPSMEEIVDGLSTGFGVRTDVKTVKETIEACQGETSMSAKIGEDGDTEFGDMLTDFSVKDPGESIDNETISERLSHIISCLSASEKRMVMCRYGVGIPRNGMSEAEIASMFAVPESEISAIAKSASVRINVADLKAA